MKAQLTFYRTYFRDRGLNERITIGKEHGIEYNRREANLETARRLRNVGINDNDIHNSYYFTIRSNKHFMIVLE